MTTSFRLLSVTSAGAGQELQVARRQNIADSGSNDNSWSTVLIGKNGVGKSRLLSCAANTFDILDRGPRHSFDPCRVEYQVGNDICTLNWDGRWLSGEVDSVPAGLDRIPRPTRVAAITASAFDKFPLPPRIGSLLHDAGLYRYLGLKDDRGLISPTAAVYRALNELFAATGDSGNDRRRIADVFEYLGYKPVVEVVYRWTMRGRSFAAAAKVDASPAEIADQLTASAYTRSSTIQRLVDSHPEIIVSAAEGARAAAAAGNGKGRLTLTASFAGPRTRDGVLFAQLKLLRRLDLVVIQSVTLTRAGGGQTVDLRETSSGELALVTGLLGIASVIESGSLLLIDEPEISLHPEWQVQYLDLLHRTFGAFQGCHIIVATHSPLIVSDVSETRSNVVSLDTKDPATATSLLSGKSSDYVLLRAFDVVGNDNLYLKQLLVEALRLAADGQLGAARTTEALSELRHYTRDLDPSDPVRTTVEQLVLAVDKFARERI